VSTDVVSVVQEIDASLEVILNRVEAVHPVGDRIVDGDAMENLKPLKGRPEVDGICFDVEV
jgi:hypothetical protein